MKNKIKLAAITLAVLVSLYPSISKAETHIRSEDMVPSGVWDKVGSPYILDDSLYIPQGYELKILEGVEVRSSNESEEPYSISFDGDLSVVGTKGEPVIFTNIYGLNFSRSSSTITYANFDGVGLDFGKSTTTIAFVNIKNAFSGITARGSSIRISSSTLENNSYGIRSNFQQTMYMASLPGFTDISIDKTQNVIQINNSRIINSVYNGILNETSNPVDARQNWWGKQSGPNSMDISGQVIVDPWLIEDPNIKKEVICCSNVVFIPGLEASRLYKDERGLLGFSTTTNTLWEPNRNGDVKNLYLDTNGKSVLPNIYTKDIIGVVPGIKNIYKTYIETMDKLVSDGSINEWLPMPYDWRDGVYDVVDTNFVNRVIEISKTSKTGKVVIVAHSNGGLVTKELLMELEKIGKSSIVEKVINIAVPELGTPQAVLAMLNGYNQGILLGAILSENNARTFSQNMPGAYGLLPNQRYFEKNNETLISDSFSGLSSSSLSVTDYVNKISDFSGFKNFILNGPFSKLVTSDLKTPLKLNSSIFTQALDMHKKIDAFKHASSTKVISVFGSGLKTPASVTYQKDPHCKATNTKCGVDYLAEFRSNGDGTVLTDSNSGNADTTLFFDLKKVKNDTSKNINHANILESNALLSKIVDFLKNNDDGNGDHDKYFTTTEPVVTDQYLTVTVFSPVDIHVYDENGLHSGPTRDTPFEPGQALPRENNIPDVTYATFADNTRVIVPYGNGKNYKIVMNGKASGVFIVDADISKDDIVIASTTFSELPVFKQTNMELIVAPNLDSFASSTTLDIDVDGDGNTDVVGHTDKFLNSTSTELIKDPATFIEILNKAKSTLKINKKDERELDNKLTKIQKHLDKHRKNKVSKINRKLPPKWFKNRKINNEENANAAVMIANQLDRVLESIGNKDLD